MPAHLFRCDLPLLRPVATERGLITARTSWVVEIVTDSGARGLGEAAPLPGFGGEEPEICHQVLTKAVETLTADVVGRWLERGKPDAPLGHILEPLLSKAPCARHAIESALIDLLARSRGVPVAACLADNGAVMIPVNALVDGPEDAAWAKEQGFRTVKAKVGGDPVKAAARALQIRAAIGSEIKLRLDANGAWTFEQALHFAHEANLAMVELVEQPIDPLRPEPLKDLANLRKRSGWKVAVDEGVRSAADVGRIGSAQAADVVVLKPMFLGGWRPTWQAIQLARTCGLGVVISGALDSAIGLAYATHMAAAANLTTFAHGLATGDRFEADLVTEPLTPKNGSLLIRERPGLGIGDLNG